MHLYRSTVPEGPGRQVDALGFRSFPVRSPRARLHHKHHPRTNISLGVNSVGGKGSSEWDLVILEDD